MKPDRTKFSLPAYRYLLDEFLSRGYEVADYESAEVGRPHLILRHDVDFSLEAAAELANFEADTGISSAYFVRVRCPLYNLHSPAQAAALSAIAQAGHLIGLHFDAALYADEPEVLDRAAETECDILENILGEPVSVLSFHRPARSLLGLDRQLAGRRHTYEPRFFNEMGYCSDSRGAWHHGHPLDHEAVRGGRALQLLTHAEWWVGDASLSTLDRLEKLIARFDQATRDAVAADCEPYRDYRASNRRPASHK